ncbi:MAG: ABC transporter ATP-binding protein [Bacteroidales bacterium]|nr:ABC transporter ATP-binding protein [Bacteroidales bacterium]
MKPLLQTYDLAVGHSAAVRDVSHSGRSTSDSGRLPAGALITGINLQVGPGECILLCGANGSGKTTLMRTLSGVLRPLSGRFASGPVVLVPTRILKVKGFTLREFIRLSCFKESGWDGRLHFQAEQAIATAMDLLGITDLASHDISTLSDGEFQKGCIATALVRVLRTPAQRPSPSEPSADRQPEVPAATGLILLDEPTAFLDVSGRRQVLQTLRRISAETGASFLFSSHDLSDSTAFATRVLGITPDRRLLDSCDLPTEEILSVCFPSL